MIDVEAFLAIHAERVDSFLEPIPEQTAPVVDAGLSEEEQRHQMILAQKVFIPQIREMIGLVDVQAQEVLGDIAANRESTTGVADMSFLASLSHASMQHIFMGEIIPEKSLSLVARLSRCNIGTVIGLGIARPIGDLVTRGKVPIEVIQFTTGRVMVEWCEENSTADPRLQHVLRGSDAVDPKELVKALDMLDTMPETLADIKAAAFGNLNILRGSVASNC